MYIRFYVVENTIPKSLIMKSTSWMQELWEENAIDGRYREER